MRSITTLALAGAIVLAAASPALAGHRPRASLKVSVRGTWRGRPVSFTTTFANACLMKSAGGAVFTL